MLSSEIKRLRAAYQDEIDRMDATYFVTHNFNHPQLAPKNPVGRHPGWRLIRPDRAFEMVYKFYEIMHLECYGETWREALNSARIIYGFFEAETYNPHYHVVACLHGKRARWLEKYGKREWGKLSNRGQLDIEEITSREKVRSYCTKRLTKPSAFENVFVF